MKDQSMQAHYTHKPTQTVGIAGTGALGSAVARALIKGIDGLTLTHLSDLIPSDEFSQPYVSFKELVNNCDIIVECLPPKAVPELAIKCIDAHKTLIMISGCALLMFPEILDTHSLSTGSEMGRIIVPSGALAGIDGIKAVKELGIVSSKIASTKPPRGFFGAPYVDKMGIDLSKIVSKTRIFEGNAFEAAEGFPANVNVAATLSLAGIGPDKTRVEIWADPDAKGNMHEVTVEGTYSTLYSRIENMPDPENPKSSMLAAQSIVAALRDFNNSLIIL
ncbi:MAG: DUF108 domain-containing protein [Micavibrio sp.]|nr:DUF108 domain-containing protein [Micavibrio sp.]